MTRSGKKDTQKFELDDLIKVTKCMPILFTYFSISLQNKDGKGERTLTL